MATDLQTPQENQTTLVGTIKGIVLDFQKLVEQQFAMVKAEVRSDLDKTKSAVITMASGGVLLAVSLVLFSFMFVYLLHWLTTPAQAMGVLDPAYVPLWGCFAIIGGGLALIGGGLVFLGIRQFQSFNPLPNESAEALKENVQWLTNRR
jgi:hypothetical protein